MKELSWHKSSYSQASGNSNCVEVAPGLGGVRDSKNPGGPVLIIDSLRALIKFAKVS